MSILKVSYVELILVARQPALTPNNVSGLLCVCVSVRVLGVRCCLYKGWVWLLGLYLMVFVFAEVGEAVAMKTTRGMDAVLCAQGTCVCYGFVL